MENDDHFQRKLFKKMKQIQFEIVHRNITFEFFIQKIA